MNGQTTFKTDRAAWYLKAMCRHFGRRHKARVQANTGWIELPVGRCEMTADDVGLTVTISAVDAAGLDKAKVILGSHLERFAFRENPQIVWRSATPATFDA